MPGTVSLQRIYAKVIFDMDGTLVDSRTVVERVWRKWALKLGVSADRILTVAHGRRTREIMEMFAPEGMDIEQATSELEAEESDDANDIVAIPGALELLQWIPAGDWAVVTSATRELASRRMLEAGLPLPHLLISAEDVAAGKPHPQGYSMASDRMRARPTECLVFEDAPAGILAAKAAGCDVVAITAAHSPDFAADCPMVADFHCIAFSLRSSMHTRRWSGGSK
jgi:sugar-phosphatase